MNQTFKYNQDGNKIITVRRDYRLSEKNNENLVDFLKQLSEKGIIDLKSVISDLSICISESAKETSKDVICSIDETLDDCADKIAKRIKK